MECEEIEATNEVDDCIPIPVTFRQKLGPRFVAAIALFGPAAAVFLMQHLSSRHELIQVVTETQPPTGYTIETAAATPAPQITPAPTAPVTVDVIAAPPRSVTDQPATLQLTTKPAGAVFAVYAGIIA